MDEESEIEEGELAEGHDDGEGNVPEYIAAQIEDPHRAEPLEFPEPTNGHVSGEVCDVSD